MIKHSFRNSNNRVRQIELSQAHSGGLRAYIIGFVLSVMLTLGSYFVVTEKLFGLNYMVIIIIALACAQLVVQLIFFLHLGREDKPRWNRQMLYLFGTVVLIVVIGSIWIMHHLDYNMMPDMDGNMRGGQETVREFMKNREGI